MKYFNTLHLFKIFGELDLGESDLGESCYTQNIRLLTDLK